MVALDSFYPMTGVTEQLAQWQTFSPSYFSDGVVPGTLNSFSAAQHAPPGMSVDVATGQCFIQGVFGENGSAKQLTIAAADATNPRIDRVVLRCDTVAQNLQVLVITGVAAVSPSAPALVRSATQTDYSLYQVLVGTTVTSIVTANLTDERTWASPRGIPLASRVLTAASTIQPYGPSPLTESHLQIQVSGTTSIANIATSPAPPKAGAFLFLDFLTTGATVQSGGGNVILGRNYVAGGAHARLSLLWDGVQWLEIGRSAEQAPAHQYLGNPTGAAAVATFAAIVAADLPVYGTFTLTSMTQGGTTTTFTPSIARFTQLGKLAVAYINLTFTSAGTAAAAIVATLPAALAMAASQQSVGNFTYNHAGVIYVGTVQFVGTTTLQFITTSQGNYLGAAPSFAVGSADTLSFMITPELA